MEILAYLAIHIACSGLGLWLWVLWWLRDLDLILGTLCWATFWAVLFGPIFLLSTLVLWLIELGVALLDALSDTLDGFGLKGNKVLFKKKGRKE